MRRLIATLAAGLITAAAAPAAAPQPGHPATIAEHQAQCAGKDGWGDPAPPVRVFGNVYDVGTCGIVVLLVTGPRGHVVIDGATAQAAPQIIANIERLGFAPRDVKLLLSTHEHADHAGGLAELQRRTGARLLASPAARPTLQRGRSDPADPQDGSLPTFMGARVDGELRDGQVVGPGPLRLTAHLTPGHAPGSTSWSWRSCEGRVCHQIVYADSFTAISSDAYRYSDHPAYVAGFRASIAKVGRLRCDLLITPHPGASNLYERLAGQGQLLDAKACAAYAASSAHKLDERLAKEADH